jgi:hypothetical protein
MLIQDQVDVFQWLSYIKIWWAYVGTLSNFGTLFRHNITKRLATPALNDEKIHKHNSLSCAILLWERYKTILADLSM